MIEYQIGNYHIESYQLILLLAAIIGLAVEKQIEGKFVWFLWGCVLFELVLGKLASRLFGNNLFVFNIFGFYCTTYYFWYFFRKLKNTAWTYWLPGILAIYMLFFVGNLIFFQGVFHLNNYSYVLGMMIVLLMMSVYIGNVLVNKEFKLFLEQSFWLGVGIILFYTSNFPNLLFLDEILQQKEWFYGPIYNLVTLGNHFLSLGYLMVVLCPLLSRHFSKRSSMQRSSFP